METKALTPSAASHNPRREMAVLGLLETLLSFAAIYAMVRVAAASATYSRTRGCFRISMSGKISTTAGA